jgi:hypothetical protein
MLNERLCMLSINLNKTALIITLAMYAHSVEAAALRFLARPTPDRMPEETSQRILELQQEAAGLSPQLIAEVNKWYRTVVCTTDCRHPITRESILDGLAVGGAFYPECVGIACTATVSCIPVVIGTSLSVCCLATHALAFDGQGRTDKATWYRTTVCNPCNIPITRENLADGLATTCTFHPTCCGAVGTMATGSPLPFVAGILATLFGLGWYEQWRHSTQGPSVQRYNAIQEEIAQLKGAPSFLDCGPF